MVKLPPYQESVAVGLILSDGFFNLGKPHENPSLNLKQSLKNFPYVWFVYSIFSHYCNILPYFTSSVRKGTSTYGVTMTTRGLPCFKELHQLFIINKVKVIPKDIYNLLTPVALAHIIMGDGQAREYGLYLCLDCFNVEDVVKFINVLIIKYNINCTLHFHRPYQPRIYIRQNSMEILRNIVKPYMEPSMYYKIGIKK